MTYMSLGTRKLLIYGWALEFCKSLDNNPYKNLLFFATRFWRIKS